MSDFIYINGVEFVSAIEAGKEFGITNDYVTQFCRRKQIHARRVGHSWYVEREGLKNFIIERERTAIRRSEELARQRAEEYRRLNGKRRSSTHVPRLSAVLQLGSLLVALGLTLGTLAIADTAYGRFTGDSHSFAYPSLAAAGNLGDSLFNWLTSLWGLPNNQSDYVPPRWEKTVIDEKASFVEAKQIPPTIVNNNPVVERVVETERIVVEGGLTEELLSARLNDLNNRLTSQMMSLTSANSTHVTNVYQSLDTITRVDSLTSVDLDMPTITDGIITGTAISAESLAVTGTATSTFANGIDISDGCLAIDGTCIGTGGGSATGTATQVQFNDYGSFGASAAFTFATGTEELSVTRASSTYATSTNATSTNLYSSSLIAGNATSTNFFSTNASTSNATSTNLFATLAHFSTAVIDAITNLVTTNLIATNATTTQATTTNFAISSITSALPLAAADGSLSEYAGTSCTNQFIRSLNGAGAATCATVDLTLDVTGDLPFANLAQVAAASLLGNPTGSTADAQSVATSTLFGVGTPGYVLAFIDGQSSWVATTTLANITGTLAVAKGGTGVTSFSQGWVYSDGGSTLAASTSPTINYVVATSTTGVNQFWGNTGFATGTPWAQVAINPIAGQASNSFVIGSSTATRFIVDNSGNVGVSTAKPWGRLSVSGAGLSQTWTEVGTELNIADVLNPAIAALSPNRVAFIDATNDDLRVYEFNGSTWTQIGTELNIVGVGSPTLAALSPNRVAFFDSSNDDLRVYEWNGTTWTEVGTELSIVGNPNTPALAALSPNRVALFDNFIDTLRVYEFNGSTWSQIGNPLSITTSSFPTLAALSPNRVAFIDSTNADLRVYEFDGTNWSQIGNDLNISGVDVPALAALSPNRVAFIDRGNDDLRTYQFSSPTFFVGDSEDYPFLAVSDAGYTTAEGLAVRTTLNVGQSSTSTAASSSLALMVNGASIFSSVVSMSDKLGIGTTTPFWKLQVADTSASASFRGQMTLTDTNGGTNLKHWTFRSIAGSLEIGSSSDAYATTTLFSITNASTTIAKALFSSSVATSSFANGINLTGGCWAVAGTCLGAGANGFNWTDGGAFLSPLTAGDGVLVNSASSTITNLVMVNSTTTNATTTGNAYFASSAGIGTANPIGRLSVSSAGLSQTWTLVGSLDNIPTVGAPALAALSLNRVAFIDDTNGDLRVYEFNGSTWTQIGTGLNIVVVDPSLAALSPNRVAFFDAANLDLRVYEFNGSTWSQIGSNLTISAGTPALAALSSNRVAFIDATNEDLRVYEFNGSTWTLIGSLDNIATVGNPSLAALSPNRVAFIDATNEDLRVYEFNGSTWTEIGTELNISGVSVRALAALSPNRVALIDSVNDDLRTYQFSSPTFFVGDSEEYPFFSVSDAGYTSAESLGIRTTLRVGQSATSTWATSTPAFIVNGISTFSGLVGLGTTSPFAQFTIQGNQTATSGALFAIGVSGISDPRIVVNARGNLGLGTSTPNWLLQIASSSASASFRGQFTLSDTNAGTDAKHWTFRSVAGSLQIGTSSDVYATSTYLTITNGGKVGIGTTSPNASLTVHGTISGSAAIAAFSRTTLGAGRALEIALDAVMGSSDADTVYRTQMDSGTNGGHAFYVSNSGTESFAMGINRSGNVGIGTSTPQWKLQLASASGPQLTLSTGNATDAHWSFQNSEGTLYLASSSPTTFAPTTKSVFSISDAGVFTINPDKSPALDFRISGASLDAILFADASQNKLGVGSESPGYLLDVFSSDDTWLFKVGDSDAAPVPLTLIGPGRIGVYNQGAPDTLTLNPSGGNVQVASTTFTTKAVGIATTTPQ